MLVDERVEQILILRKEIGLGRTEIVRAYDGLERAVGGQRRDRAPDGVWMHAHVGIDEEQEVLGRRPRPDVPRSRRTAALRDLNHLDARAARDPGRIVPGAVVDYDTFGRRNRTARQRVEAGLESARAITHRYDNRNGMGQSVKSFDNE